MTQTPQTDLVRRAARGDRGAGDALVRLHRRTTEALAFRALRNADDAADVAQESLVYAMIQLPTLREPERFSGWLRQITLTHCAEYRRRRGTRRLGEPMTVLNEQSEEADHAQRLAIRDSLSDLSEAHQTTFLLHYLGGWSLTETADLLDVPLNTVRSRLATAKSLLRDDLQPLFPNPFPMTASTYNLSSDHLAILNAAFPGAVLTDVDHNPEPWQPFSPRVRFTLPSGEERVADFRSGLNLPLINRLAELGIPGPQVIYPGPMSLCEIPRGENLSLWTLGGTPHRIRVATERAIEGLDRLQACTEGLMNHPIGETLARRTLLDEVAILTEDERWNADPWLAEAGDERSGWLKDPWFVDAVARVAAACANLEQPLVYTDYTFYFPQGYRIQPRRDLPEDGEGENPLVEFVYQQGHFGDPLLGLAMVWVYDCYPFVHTGFVEQILWRRGVSRREFAPRLALKALQMVARDLPVERPARDAGHWDNLHGWAKKALAWM